MIARPGSKARFGIGMPRTAHSWATASAMPGGELLDRGRVVRGGVGDAEAAAEVEHGDVAAGEQLGVQLDEARRRLGESRRAEDLRADVAVQAEEGEAVDLADACDRGRGIRRA